jgi:hypothetical protein
MTLPGAFAFCGVVDDYDPGIIHPSKLFLFLELNF